MTDVPWKHHLVDFAARYARTSFPTLNAASAIRRLESLILEVEGLRELQKSADEKEITFGSRLNTYEIVDYYAVGFVTCLEWHARSRLVDLLHHAPGNIDTPDVKIDKVALSQMAAANVTLPYIVGAATKVSTAQDYLAIMRRIFEALQLTAKPEQLLRSQLAEPEPWQPESKVTIFDSIDELFRRRNHLVHEIDIAVMAHFSLRDAWSLDDALRVGKGALACIKTMENEITKDAPANFPNRLNADGYPDSELERLKSEIVALEKEITDAIGGDDSYCNATGWKEALAANHASLEKEFEFINGAEFLRPVRHLDYAQALTIEFLRSRLSYLAMLKKELE